MKKLLLLLVSISLFCSEPEYPWTPFNNSAIVSNDDSDSDADSIAINDCVHALFEVEDCAPEYIDNSEHIKSSLSFLCDTLEFDKIEPFHMATAVEDTTFVGYSVAQVFTAGVISGYFNLKENKAYINIFSSKIYDRNKAQVFLTDCFKNTEN